MSYNLRRGLLGTLFAGGLLALGCTAANAADTTNGSDLAASAFVKATAGSDSKTVDAKATVALTGGDKGQTAPSQANLLDAAVNIDLGGNGGSSAPTTTPGGLVDAVVDVDLGGNGDTPAPTTTPGGLVDAVVDVDLGGNGQRSSHRPPHPAVS